MEQLAIRLKAIRDAIHDTRSLYMSALLVKTPSHRFDFNDELHAGQPLQFVRLPSRLPVCSVEGIPEENPGPG